MNTAAICAVSLTIMGLCLAVGGVTRARPGQAWVWYVCGVVLIALGVFYWYPSSSTPKPGAPCTSAQNLAAAPDGRVLACAQDNYSKQN